MEETWRYSAKRVSKFNPLHRNEKGEYLEDEWVGFFQLGQSFNNNELTLKEYEKVEQLYIQAGVLFFQFHGCNEIKVEKLETENLSNYNSEHSFPSIDIYDRIINNNVFTSQDLTTLIKLILRDMIWCELLCKNNEQIAIRFGYDFYMYLNSDRDISSVVDRINDLGLYVD